MDRAKSEEINQSKPELIQPGKISNVQIGQLYDFRPQTWKEVEEVIGCSGLRTLYRS